MTKNRQSLRMSLNEPPPPYVEDKDSMQLTPPISTPSVKNSKSIILLVRLG